MDSFESTSPEGVGNGLPPPLFADRWMQTDCEPKLVSASSEARKAEAHEKGSAQLGNHGQRNRRIVEDEVGSAWTD